MQVVNNDLPRDMWWVLLLYSIMVIEGGVYGEEGTVWTVLMTWVIMLVLVIGFK